MRFEAMRFAALLRCAGSIEVAQSHVGQAGVSAVVGENLLEYQLGFAIRVDGIFGGDFPGWVRFQVRRRSPQWRKR